MNNLFSLNLLSQDFYNDYPHSFYPEMDFLIYSLLDPLITKSFIKK